jgi:hypothetical protein
MFFKEMADAVISSFKQRPIDNAYAELLQFKSLVERQTHKDVFVNGRAQENIARALLQTFLTRRSYREVRVRGGQSDLLVFDKQGSIRRGTHPDNGSRGAFGIVGSLT